MPVFYAFIFVKIKTNKRKAAVVMKILKKIKIDMWINAIMTLIIGILFIARPQGAMEVTADCCWCCYFCKRTYRPYILYEHME